MRVVQSSVAPLLGSDCWAPLWGSSTASLGTSTSASASAGASSAHPARSVVRVSFNAFCAFSTFHQFFVLNFSIFSNFLGNFKSRKLPRFRGFKIQDFLKRNQGLSKQSRESFPWTPNRDRIKSWESRGLRQRRVRVQHRNQHFAPRSRLRRRAACDQPVPKLERLAVNN